jgi:hypothetical protein
MDAYTFAFLHRLGGLIAAAEQRGELRPGLPLDVAASNVFALYIFALTAWVGGYASVDQALASLRAALELHQQGMAASPKARRG